MSTVEANKVDIIAESADNLKPNETNCQSPKNIKNGQLNEVNYIPAVNVAKKMLSLSANQLDKDSKADEGSTEEYLKDYETRLNTVSHLRYQRALKHLSDFMKAVIVINISNLAPNQNHNEIRIPMIVPRTKTIEELTKRIEAEYAFMFMEQTIEKVNKNPENFITSLHVVMVHDIGEIPLKFSSQVQEVINSGDVINVVGVLLGSGDSINHRNMTKARTSGFPRFLAAREDRELEKSLVPSERLLATLHNIMAINYFQEFCMQDYEIENLLFWLEVEVFRGVAKQALIENQNELSSDAYIIAHTNSQYAKLLLHARYIYFTFLAPGSSLRLNIPSDLYLNFEWPLPKLDPVTGLHKSFSSKIFDDLQEHIFYYLASYVHLKYEKSSFYQQYLETRDAEKDEYKISHFFPGEHYQKFQQDIEGMEKAVEEALASGVEQAPVKRAPSQQVNFLEGTAVFNRVLSGSAFFGDGPRITTAQKVRRVQREKKLKKFFGEKPIKDDPYADASTAKFDHEFEDLEEASSVNDSLDRNTKSTNPETISFVTQDDDDDVATRKKKVDKLEDFFGVNRLPAEQLFEQKLVDTLEIVTTISESEIIAKPAPPTKNDLTPSEKRNLMNRTRKLQGVLGETLDEEAIRNTISKTTKVLERKETDDSISELKKPEKDIIQARRSRRAGSIGSITTNDSTGTSLASLSGQIRKNRDAKDLKRKKLEKIQQFLGEKISSNMLSDLQQTDVQTQNLQLSGKERTDYMKKMYKLQTMFGEQPPTAIVAASPKKEEEDHELLQAFGGEILLSYVVKNPQLMRELVLLLDEFDKEEGLIFSSGEELDGTEKDGAKTKSSEFATKFQQMHQRKRLGKLTRFFGSPAGPITSEMSGDDEKLLSHLESLIDPQMLKNFADKHKIDLESVGNEKKEAQKQVVANNLEKNE